MRDNNRQLRAVMDSDTLALLYFIVILLIMVNGSRAAAPKGTMFCIKTSISTPSDLEAGGQRLKARGWRPEAGGTDLGRGGWTNGRMDRWTNGQNLPMTSGTILTDIPINTKL